MIVTCKNCGTKFRINEDLIPPAGRKVKCSKCSNIFVIKSPTKIDKIEEDEEVFRLDDEKEKKTEETKEKTEAKDEVEDFGDLEEELEDIAQKYKKPATSKKGKTKKRSRLTFVITMAMLIIAIFVGSVFVIIKTKNRVPPFRFSNLSAKYYENSKFGTVLVIKGKLYNNRNTAFTKVLLKAYIYDSQGKKIKEGSTFVGNVFNKEEILNLTPEYVKKFIFDNVIVKPQSSQEFMIFLFDLPKISYSYQVEVANYKKVKKRR